MDKHDNEQETTERLVEEYRVVSTQLNSATTKKCHKCGKPVSEMHRYCMDCAPDF